MMKLLSRATVYATTALASFLSPKLWNQDLELAGRALRTALQHYPEVKVSSHTAFIRGKSREQLCQMSHRLLQSLEAHLYI